MKIIDAEEYLYHVTTSENVDAIMQEGLMPQKIAGMPSTNEPNIICLTNFRHITDISGDGQREIILRIDKNGIDADCFYKDYSHTLYTSMKGKFSESHIIDFMFTEYGTIGYRCLILPEFIQIVES